MPGYQRNMTTWDVRPQLQAYQRSIENVGRLDGSFGLRPVRNFGSGARESMDERLEQEVAARRAVQPSKTLNRIKSGRIEKQQTAAPKAGIKLTGPGQSNIAVGRAYEAGHTKACARKGRVDDPPRIKMFSQPTKKQVAQDFTRDHHKTGLKRPARVQPAIKMSSKPVTMKKAAQGSITHHFGIKKPKIRQVQAVISIKRC